VVFLVSEFAVNTALHHSRRLDVSFEEDVTACKTLDLSVRSPGLQSWALTLFPGPRDEDY